MKPAIVILILFSFLVSCNVNRTSESETMAYPNTDNTSTNDINSTSQNSDEYSNGTYCADVEYYNPSTGTRNTYNLNVEVEDGDLTVIHWPNSGWLDNSHFYPEDITDGKCEFTSDRGYRYTVTLTDRGGCGYTDEYKIRRDVNNEVEQTTCPKCGDEKDTYDDYCDDCQDEIEHTCKRCGQVDNFMFSIDDYCSDCKDELEKNEYE